MHIHQNAYKCIYIKNYKGQIVAHFLLNWFKVLFLVQIYFSVTNLILIFILNQRVNHLATMSSTTLGKETAL